uniref:Phospholipase n=1 Tax=Prevotella sp. GTC17262 TaxID=3236797 RepID=A0AB33JDF0_9BACT
MIFLILILIALGGVAAVLGTISSLRGESDDIVQPTTSSCATCTGENDMCEQDCMLEAAVKDIEYFDDEELDAYRDRPSDSYSDTEADEFSEIMYTMKPEEVKAWNRSLILRGINMPDQIKDEFIALAQ